MKTSRFWGMIALLLLAACQSSAPLHQYSKGAVLASYDFSTAGSFEEGAYGTATLEVVNGAYEIDVNQGDDALWWGQWGDNYGDVVIDVDTTQLSQTTDDAYGVMCRVLGSIGQPQPVDPTLAAIMTDTTPLVTAESTSSATAQATAQVTLASTASATAQATAEMTAQATAQAAAEATAQAAATSALQLPTPALTPTASLTPPPLSDGDGYLFLIQSSGSFAIMRSRGRNLTPLLDWKSSDAIKQGPSQNHLRAICDGSYLAFYVNDQFVGDATDDTYNTGQVGLAASSADRLGTRISFDNLTVSQPVETK